MTNDVVVCGSRSIVDYEPVRTAIKNAPFDVDKIIHGGAHGVDKRAMDYALFNSIDVEVVRPDYEKYSNVRAPLERNEKMVKMADAVIAVWDGESKGTNHTMNVAKKNGMEKVKEMTIDNIIVRYFVRKDSKLEQF